MNVATLGDNSLIRAYDPFRVQLTDLKREAPEAFDYEDPKGNKDARSYIHKLRLVKGEVERTRKAEKQESLELGRRIDAQAKEIIEEIETLIDVHAKPIQEIEQREQQRLETIKSHFATIASLTAKADPFGGLYGSENLRTNLATLEGLAIEADVFRESLADAERAKNDGVTVLKSHIAEAEKREAEAAELERLRKEAVERERQEREERIAREAAEKAKQQAEEAAAQREADLKEQAARAERQKQEAEEKAARAAAETEARVAREAQEKEARERAEAEKREANKRHRGKINKAAADALVAGGLSEQAAKAAVTLIAKGEVPAVSIAY